MSDSRRRVVITGLGAITPVGNDVPSTWDALLAGESGAGPITIFEITDEYVSRIACEVKDFDPLNFLEKKEARRYDRFAQFSIVAADEAMRSARLEGAPDGVAAERFGVIFGSGIGGISTMEAQHDVLRARGPGRVSPFFIPMFIPDIAAGLISIRFASKGPNYATVSACASGAHAIGDAFRFIERGDADVMIAGGGEATITPLAVAGFSSMKALSTRNDDPAGASRPFDAGRDGFVIGEGAGCVVLEALETAEARGATIVAEVIGYGVSADAHHITMPAPEGKGAQYAMRMAMNDGGVSAEDVDYINAHGTSTQANDRNETAAIKQVLGDSAYSVIVGSTKSMTGHLLGAAGGVEAVITALVCQQGRIPSTINLTDPDPDCDLDYGQHGVVERTVEVALSNSFGFGGHNACLAIRAWGGE
ncbi:MAG: beta-ketoacyl-ACP synthase II [Gemmatimonadetes bacterium]|nr:beta-ketoacyl-ACP synthase II [Gemmatimonadota bacterium]